jgi:hypothetical protein
MIADKVAQNEIPDLGCLGQAASYALDVEHGTGRTDSPMGSAAAGCHLFPVLALLSMSLAEAPGRHWKL